MHKQRRLISVAHPNKLVLASNQSLPFDLVKAVQFVSFFVFLIFSLNLVKLVHLVEQMTVRALALAFKNV